MINLMPLIILIFFGIFVLNILKSSNFKAFIKKRHNGNDFNDNGEENGTNFKNGTSHKAIKIPGKLVFVFVLIILIAGSVFNSVYTVDQSEQALIFRFGAVHSTITTPGLKFKMPFIDTIEFVNTEQVRRLEYGFRSDFEPKKNMEYSNEKYSDIASEKTMITGDENLVEVEVIVQYRVIDPVAYLLNVDDPDGTLELAAYSRIRRVVSNHTLDDILTLNKAAMQQEMLEDIQEISNKYGLGLLINAVQLQDVDPPEAVASAFTDVASAKEDKERYINEANQYANKILPESRAQKQKLLNEAEAYKMVRINSSEGDVSRFKQVLEKYESNKDITKTRMYIETMREVLPKVDIYIVDGDNMTMLPVKGYGFSQSIDTELNKSIAGAAINGQ